MMKKLSRRYFRHKTDGRRFVFVAATVTVSVIVFVMLVHSHKLNNHYLSPLEIVSSNSNQSFNSTKQPIEFPKLERFQQVHHSLPTSVISPNLSNRLEQSIPVKLETEIGESHLRKNSTSGRKEDDKLADATKIVTPSPPHGFVPNRLQVEVDATFKLTSFFF